MHNKIFEIGVTIQIAILYTIGFTLNENETRVHSALCLAGANEPTNQSAESAFVSFLLNGKQTRTKPSEH